MKEFKQFSIYMKKNFGALFRLVPFFWSDDKNMQYRFLIVIYLLVIGIILSLLGPLILKQVILFLENPDMVYYIAIIPLLSYCIIWLFSQLVVSIRELYMFPILERAITKLNIQLLYKLYDLSFQQHIQRKTGGLTNGLERAQRALPVIIYGVIFILIPTLTEIFLAAGLIWFLYDFYYSAIFFLVLLFFIGFSIIGAQKGITYRQHSNQQHRNTMGHLVDRLLNYEVIRYFNNQDYELKVYDEAQRQRETLEIKALSFMESVHFGQIVILGFGFTIISLFVGYNIVHGDLGVSDFVLINGLVLQFSLPLSSFGGVFRETHQAFIDLEYIFKILDSKTDNNNRKKLLSEDNVSIELKHVNFSYEDNRSILKNINFCVNSGESIAIVGSTGAGKSTLVKLLFQFFQPNSGVVLFNGVDGREIEQKVITKILGIVPQDTILFNMSIADNIRYAKLDATDEEVVSIAKQAQLHQFIQTLPNKYNTIVGERGIRLSGGEKQRIAIARVLLRAPSIYIFDEATSSLDDKTESMIQKQINQLSKVKTSIIITHELRNIVNVDRIYVIKDGEIIEKGSHQELVKAKDHYFRLWQGYQVVSDDL